MKLLSVPSVEAEILNQKIEAFNTRQLSLQGAIESGYDRGRDQSVFLFPDRHRDQSALG